MKMFSVLLACLMLSMPALAAVSPQEAARLGNDLTPVGAEKSGNGRDIPAWTGGLPKDTSHVPGAYHKDPFATDKPLFRINAAYGSTALPALRSESGTVTTWWHRSHRHRISSGWRGWRWF